MPRPESANTFQLAGVPSPAWQVHIKNSPFKSLLHSHFLFGCQQQETVFFWCPSEVQTVPLLLFTILKNLLMFAHCFLDFIIALQSEPGHPEQCRAPGQARDRIDHRLASMIKVGSSSLSQSPSPSLTPFSGLAMATRHNMEPATRPPTKNNGRPQ